MGEGANVAERVEVAWEADQRNPAGMQTRRILGEEGRAESQKTRSARSHKERRRREYVVTKRCGTSRRIIPKGAGERVQERRRVPKTHATVEIAPKYSEA